MKKVLALVIALTLMCGMLVSCGSPESLLEKADAALQKAPYEITMRMDFECDNAEMNQVLSALNMEIPMIVDGKNISMDMNMNLSGYTAKAEVTVADMVVYYNMEVMNQNVKMKATMDEEQYQKFMAENNSSMAVNYGDFGVLTVEKKDGKKYISCSEINEEGLKELNDMMKDSLKSLGGEATVSDVSYVVTLKDGKYESVDMTCTYSVTIYGQTVNITFTLGTEFSYDNIEKITAPADADTYQETSFDDLIG